MSHNSLDYNSFEANLDDTVPSYIDKLEDYQTRIPQAKLVHTSLESRIQEGRTENISQRQDVDFRAAPFQNSSLGPTVASSRSSFVFSPGPNMDMERTSADQRPPSNQFYRREPREMSGSRSDIQGRNLEHDRSSFMNHQRISQYDAESLRPNRPPSSSMNPNGPSHAPVDHRSSLNLNSAPNGLGPVDRRRSSHLTDGTGIRAMNRNSNDSSFMDTYSVVPDLVVNPVPSSRAYGDWLLAGYTDHERDVPFQLSIGFKVISIISALVIVGDAVFDWYVTYNFDDYSCSANSLLDGKFYKYDICNANMEAIRQALVVFTMCGSILAVIQVVNIFLSFMQHKGKTKFEIFKPLSEVFVSVFLSEIPQSIALLVFMFNCDCSNPSRQLSIGMMMIGFMKTILRYLTAFNSSSDRGCLRTFCCCREDSAECKLWPNECFCACTMPCPFSSKKKKTHFGICILENLGILCLFCCFLAGLVLFGLSDWS